MQYFQMVVRLQSDMEDEAEALSAGVSPDEIKESMDSIARLTDIPFPTDFSAKIPALSLVDAILRQVVFNWKAAESDSGFYTPRSNDSRLHSPVVGLLGLGKW